MDVNSYEVGLCCTLEYHDLDVSWLQTTAIKWVAHIFWFPSVYKSYVYTILQSIKFAEALHLKKILHNFKILLKNANHCQTTQGYHKPSICKKHSIKWSTIKQGMFVIYYVWHKKQQKKKMNKLDCIKVKNFCASKDTIIKMRRQPQNRKIFEFIW